jgi:hypothetical protein
MRNQPIILRTILLLLIVTTYVPLTFAQWNTFGGNSVTTTEYLGADGTSTIPLKLKTIAAYPIDFHTNNSVNPRMRIASTGEVGIGTTTPAFLLDVNGGDINVNTIANGYMINSNYVMRHETGFTSSLNVGVSAGSLTGLGNNIYAGYFTGVGASSGISI